MFHQQSQGLASVSAFPSLPYWKQDDHTYSRADSFSVIAVKVFIPYQVR
jgi:hypothetical protein